MHCGNLFAVTPRARAVLVDPTSGQSTETFRDQRHMFGRTEKKQIHRLKRESYAYYGFVKPASIKQIVFMSPEFEYEKVTQSNIWLQTVSF